MHKNAFGGRALPGSAPLSALQTLTKVKSRRRRKNRTNVKMGKTGRKKGQENWKWREANDRGIFRGNRVNRTGKRPQN